MNREELIRLCILYRADLNGLSIGEIEPTVLIREQQELEKMSADQLLREYEWLYEMVFYK